MKKIAIISELTNDTLNYGNRLQSFALNYYLSSLNKKDVIHSLILCFEDKKYNVYEKIITKFKKMIKSILFFFHLIDNHIETTTSLKESKSWLFENRLYNCQNFTRTINVVCVDNMAEIKNQGYDLIFVGSDIVWKQEKDAVDRLKFLDFKLDKTFKKVSYAASLGENWIPKANKKYIKTCLSDFDSISVREKSSIDLLKSIGVENVVHVCDPTLLLTEEEWSSVAEPVEEVTDKYIFVYLLGKDDLQRQRIKDLARKNDLKVATIPHADSNYNSVDDAFGDYKLMDASPGNWVWLIKNAEYVITDSFHGSVFSTIFNKKFLVVKRHWGQNINIRMQDFLDTIGEQDKFVDILNVSSFSEFVWDYSKIHNILSGFIDNSKGFIKERL